MPRESGQIPKTKKLSDRIERILENYIGPGICSLSNITVYFGMSERSLRRSLKAEGTTYNRIRQKVTLHQAKKLLTEAEMPVREISKRLGYHETANFIRFFKRHTGMSPHQYRLNA